MLTALRGPPTISVNHWSVPGRVPTFAMPATNGKPTRYWLRIEDDRADFAASLTLFREDALQARREKASPLLTAEARARVIADLRASGVDVARAPSEALADLIESCAPGNDPNDNPALRERAGSARSVTGIMRGCWRGTGRSGQSA